jgi:uncharacterized repeat protein (TIGR01451 family)
MNRLLLLIICNLSLIIPVSAQVMFHEDFEVPDSVVHYTPSGMFWGTNSRLQSSGLYSDSVAISSPGDSVVIRTLAFSTIGSNNIYLKFDHISKIEFFDNAVLYVSPDSGQSWIRLVSLMGFPYNNCAYFGYSLYQTQNASFHEASYVEWLPGTNTLPQNSWWKTELFDITSVLYNCQNAMVMFVVKDHNNNGTGFSIGTYYLDNIIIKDDLFPYGTQVKGTFYMDSNFNAINDPGEELGDEYYNWISDTITNRGGHVLNDYYFHWWNTTPYYLLPGSIPYYTITPGFYSGNLSTNGQVDSQRDFGYQAAGTFNDLQLNFWVQQAWRPNKIGQAFIMVRNVGTTVLSPVVKMVVDTGFTFISASIAPNQIVGDTITWNLSALSPLTLEEIHVSLLSDSMLVAGMTLQSYADVEPFSGDQTPVNNTDTSISYVFASFDPNAIFVNRDTVFSWELISPPYLEYQIVFQNTGNDTAFNISVLNQIPLQFDITSFEFTGSSHPMELIYNDNLRLMIFKFENILLPDSNVNEAASHGFITYRIKPGLNLSAPSSISNQARIYFDYNAPVTTNTAITQIVLPTGIGELPALADNLVLKIFPNPTSDHVTMIVDRMEHEYVHVEIYDMLGKQSIKLFDGTVPDDHFTITGDLAGLPAGMYLLQLRSANQSVQRRLVKY